MFRERILYSGLSFICREMNDSIGRLARSPQLAGGHTQASAILDGHADIVTQHQHRPAHLYALSASARHVMSYYAFDIEEGDLIVTADPYMGGTQGHCLTLIKPLFTDGENLLTLASRFPLIDFGGDQPGPLQVDATELWQEAFVLTPVKLFRGGKLQRDVHRFILRNSRAPHILERDLQAVNAAFAHTEARIGEYLARYGCEEVLRAMGVTRAYCTRRVMRHLESLSGKALRGQATMDVTDMPTLRVCVTIRLDGAAAIFDFTDSSPQSDRAVNATPQTVKALSVLPLLAPMLDELDLNAGLVEPFVFELPERSIVNPARPAAVNLSTHLTEHLILAAVNDALAAAGERDAPVASHGISPSITLYPPVGSSASMVPLQPQLGYAPSAAGWGPGLLQAGSLLASAEELELDHGLRLDRRELDAAGNMQVSIVNLGSAMEVSMLAVGELSDQANPEIRHAGQDGLTTPELVAGRRVATNETVELCYPGVSRGD